jgi:hypothetical protein
VHTQQVQLTRMFIAYIVRTPLVRFVIDLLCGFVEQQVIVGLVESCGFVVDLLYNELNKWSSSPYRPTNKPINCRCSICVLFLDI